jgi:hypothetical protein
MTQSFSHRQARSSPLIGTLAVLVILETAGLHLLLFPYSVLLALAVSLLSLLALIWLIADYIALGRLTTIITDESIVLRVGRRARATIPLKLLKTAISPSWRDLPDAPNRSYLNVTKPAEPNVLLTFSEPVIVNLPGGLRRSISILAVLVDTPESFLAAIQNGKRNAGGRAA